MIKRPLSVGGVCDQASGARAMTRTVAVVPSARRIIRVFRVRAQVSRERERGALRFAQDDDPGTSVNSVPRRRLLVASALGAGHHVVAIHQ